MKDKKIDQECQRENGDKMSEKKQEKVIEGCPWVDESFYEGMGAISQ